MIVERVAAQAPKTISCVIATPYKYLGQSELECVLIIIERMANNKTGFSYYNTDTDRYQDLKIKRLKKDFGCNGIAVYDYILCEIYRVRGYFIAWDSNTAFDVADYFGLKENLVNDIVAYCCAVGLFDKELRTSEKILTSLSIQLRYVEMCARSKRINFKIDEKYSKLPEEMPKLPEESGKLPEESPKTPPVCRKVKKSKVKESKGKIKIIGNDEVLAFGKDDALVSLRDCYHCLLNAPIWCEDFCRNNRLTPIQLDDSLRKFFVELQNRGESAKSAKDAKFHFANWFKLNKNKNDETDRKLSKADKTRNLLADVAAHGEGYADSLSDEEVLNW